MRLLLPPRFALRRRVAILAALTALVGCVELVTQIGSEDVVEVLVSVDSAQVAIGRTLDLEALPLDATGAFLSGVDVEWLSRNPAVADVDPTGLVTGVSSGSVQIVAMAAGAFDSAVVAVAPLPALVLSDDSVRFVTAAGAAAPSPDSIVITNGGGFELVGLTIDSIAYVPGANGWLLARLDQTTAPAQLILEPATGDVSTTGTYRANAWLSGFDADNSPARVSVVLDVTAGLADSIAASAGDGQTAPVATAVPIPPAVRILDALGNGVAGTGVTFAVTSGGGSVTGATTSADADGVARVGSWTLGTAAGTGNNTLSATVIDGPLVGSTVSFTASAAAGAASTLTVVAGAGQTATVNTPVPVPPRVVVRDQYGNPLIGHPVTFTITGGGGEASPTAPVPTDAAGEASLDSWTLGTTAGSDIHVLTIGAPGIATPVSITASATPGGAASIVVAAGNGQSATVNTSVAVRPRVLVGDQYGNPISGHAVTFQVTSGGGSVAPSTAILTQADGSAAVASWTLGTSAGANNNTLSATAAGVAGGVVFTASATAEVAASIELVSGNGQTATVATAVPVDP